MKCLRTASRLGSSRLQRYMVQLTWPMIAIGWVVNLVQRGAASVVRIDELMTEKPAIDDSAADALPADRACRRHRVSRSQLCVCGADAGRSEVLHDVVAQDTGGQQPGDRGTTGSGKSTLVADSAAAGAAPGNGADRRPAGSRVSAARLCGQHWICSAGDVSVLRDDSREYRVRAAEATDEQVVEAAEAAHIGARLRSFLAGFETLVGERGMTLSGGQKQRTAIARAVMRDPRILILDDALASVDTYTEEQILRALRRAMQGRTTVLISHRVSTARNADRIAVLVAGRIVELGTHEELTCP